MKYLPFLFLFSFASLAQNVRLSGYLYESKSKESIVGASITICGQKQGVLSNAYGYFSIEIPANQSVCVRFSSVAYQVFEQTFKLNNNQQQNILLSPSNQTLETLEVKAEKLADTEISVVKMSIQQIKQIPSLFGEKDPIKAIQLLPGVQKGVEGSTALYVRGGGADQNLIILDEAPVYNANHLFGFFSVFNSDAIKNISFWKGGFPARYGGRLSSVIDIQMKDGNKEKLKGEGGIGLLSSRLTLEIPVVKSKSSLMLSGRRTYIDLLTKPLMPVYSKQGYYFYDLNLKFSSILSPKDKLFISGYFGANQLENKEIVLRDSYTINTHDKLGWNNATATVRWNHLFSEKLFLNTSFILSDFNFGLSTNYLQTNKDLSTFKNVTSYTSAIRDYGFKTDFDYFPNNRHAIKFGTNFTLHHFQPRVTSSNNNGPDSLISGNQVFNNQEIALYAEDTYQVTERLSANIGLRFSGLITNTKNFIFAEPRLNLGYRVGNNWQLKASYSRSNQFVHLLSNTGVGLSTDLWVPSTDRVPPQQADQLAIGVSKRVFNNRYTLSIESYRKWMQNIISYKEGATFVSLGNNDSKATWEDNITFGKGLSYGTEFLLQKEVGKLKGWLGYTLAWTVHQFEELNNGKPFYPRFDRRHDLSLVLQYQLSPKITLSANWVYASGNALTVPQGFYYGLNNFGNSDNVYLNGLAYLGSRNSFRADAYHRLDLGIEFHKQKKWGERIWEISIVNAYNRKNPYYYFLNTSNSGRITSLGKSSLLPILPSVSYHFKF